MIIIKSYSSCEEIPGGKGFEIGRFLSGIFRRITAILVLLLPLLSVTYSQVKEIGTPFIRNFSKHDYKAGTQNWAIAQDKKGFMYFANNEGLLVFDGVQWELFEMPNSSMVRSIYINDLGDIYVGAYNEMGKMVTGKNGRLEYHSMKDRIPPEYQNFDDVWNILPYKDKIVFQSYNAAYIFNEDQSVTVLKAPSRFPNSFSVSGRLFLNDVEKGLFEFDGTEMRQVRGCEKLIGKDINSVMPFSGDNEILICTLDKGLFIFNGNELREWNIPVSSMLKKFQIFSATTLHDDYYALGTIQNGVIIIDNNGSLIQHINHKNGLQNNTILRVFTGRDGNLWLGLDNGIDYVTTNSPITFLRNPDGFGAGYTSLIHNGRIYIGTNQGLFVKKWDEGRSEEVFTMIPGTYGQVWFLDVLDGVLLCGHNNGTYTVSGDKATLINDIPGGWKYHILKRHPGYLIAGTYSGLILFKWQDGTWKFERRIAGFNESFRVFEEDQNGDLWMSHGFKGIYRVRLGEKLDSVIFSRFYSSADGLPTNYDLNVFRIRDKVIFTTTSDGVFEYVPAQDSFIPSSYFNQLFSPLKGFAYLKEDSQSDIWYVSDNKIGVFRRQEDLSFQQVTSPFTLIAGKFISGFETVYLYSNDHLFIGIEDGFAHYSPHAYFKSNPEFSTYITKASAVYLDSTFYFGNNRTGEENKQAVYSFPFKRNGFRFSYSAPVYDNPGNIEYSYMMAGYDEEWSPWSRDYSHEFTHLPEGSFEFMVKARNQLGIESQPDSLKILILPPWYKTTVAFIIYLLIIISALLILTWTVRKQMEVSKRRERLSQIRMYREKEKEYIRQALLAEKEIISMKNERLRIEMIQRDKELANQAMNLVRKNEFLLKITEELKSLKKAAHEETVGEKVSSIISKINKEFDHNRQREVFERAFDEVHEDFLNKLKTRYPALTPTELRLCAFLKMNISTKEIAPLMNISARGVEICRYRVRKKLNIDRSVNLTGLLIDL